jgi:multiple sugar transport system ATP-binding protein
VLYDKPANVFVAGFIGSPAMTLVTVPVHDGAAELGAGTRIPTGGAAVNGHERLVVGLRPESVELAGDGVPARVTVVEELGADAYVFCSGEVGGSDARLVARADPRRIPAIGDRVSLRVHGEDAHFFDPETGARL